MTLLEDSDLDDDAKLGSIINAVNRLGLSAKFTKKSENDIS